MAVLAPAAFIKLNTLPFQHKVFRTAWRHALSYPIST